MGAIACLLVAGCGGSSPAKPAATPRAATQPARPSVEVALHGPDTRRVVFDHPLTLGGNIRVGLEDNFYLPSGEMARSNGDLVAKARQMTEDIGRRAASVAEARTILGVPRRVAA